MKPPSFRLKTFGFLVLMTLTALLSIASFHQIWWSATHSEGYMKVLSVLASVILSGFILSVSTLSVRYYRLMVAERALKKAPRSILGHIQERLAEIRDSKKTIIVLALTLPLLVLPFLRFSVYDSSGLAVVCFVKTAQSQLLVNDLTTELNNTLLVQEVSAVSDRDVRGVLSDCEEPDEQEVGVTIYEKGMRLSATQKWVRAVLKHDSYAWIKNEQFYPYGNQTSAVWKTYPISYVADTFSSADRLLRIEYVFETAVQCAKPVCEEIEPELAGATLRSVFATLRLKSQ